MLLKQYYTVIIMLHRQYQTVGYCDATHIVLQSHRVSCYSHSIKQCEIVELLTQYYTVSEYHFIYTVLHSERV